MLIQMMHLINFVYEASTDLLTIHELQEKMKRFSKSNEAYSTKWLMNLFNSFIYSRTSECIKYYYPVHNI